MLTRSPELSALLASFTSDLERKVAIAVDAHVATKINGIGAKLFPARVSTPTSPAIATATGRFVADLDHLIAAAIDEHVATKMTGIQAKLFPAHVSTLSSPAVESAADQLTTAFERAIDAVVADDFASKLPALRAALFPASLKLPRLPAVAAATEQLAIELERAVDGIVDARVEVETYRARAGKRAPIARHAPAKDFKLVAPATPRVPPPLPVARTATVIPAGVTITRLPPGPVPRGQQSASEVRTRCRLPGCLEKHSGPRFDMFCRDHYAKLNADERAKYKEIWKAAHAPLGSAGVPSTSPVRSRAADSDAPYSARP